MDGDKVVAGPQQPYCTLEESGDAPGLDDLSGGLHEAQGALGRLDRRLDRVGRDRHRPRSLIDINIHYIMY